jgi:hypothetical protein
LGGFEAGAFSTCCDAQRKFGRSEEVLLKKRKRRKIKQVKKESI